MKDRSILFFFVSSLILLLPNSTAIDTISTNQTIRDGSTIASAGEMFELGFFSPGNSKYRYLGIWYKKISAGTVVWVANRESPITDSSGRFKVDHKGSLLILRGSNSSIWSSNSSMSGKHLNPVAQLLDNGNLVVWDKSNTKENLIWQSFDYPGDTLLPGMKFGKDLVTGRDRYLTSWKSPDDPSPGLYIYWVDTNGYPQIFKRQGSVLRLRLGPWNGIKFRGLPKDEPNPLYSAQFVVNEKEIYYKYELKSAVVQRRVLTWDGNTVQLHWIERIHEWVVYGNAAVDTCGQYGLCGPYGICSIKDYPPCSCMKGFEPRLPSEWNAADWSSGCTHKKPLDCGSGDGFMRISGVKFPDTRKSWYNMSMTLADCEMACKRNCSCTAYANLDVRNGGSGCLLWFDELMDIREYEQDQDDLYIRMAASYLAGHKGSLFSSNKMEGVLAMVLSISSTVMLLSALVYACRKKRKRLHMKAQGNQGHALRKKNTSVQIEHLDEIPVFSLNQIAKATGNFSSNNKIGEGGFGPVYKGVLEDGQEVAVKRLSETSQQGLEEFKNEVICIAKLQHRNLVKLLGYCIHGNEMILIYEYMVNGSLDSFLFGSDSIQFHGYISPEYAVHGRFSIKSDVFSFGVLVLEIVSGKKNREFSHEDHNVNLLGHAWKLYKQGRAIDLMSESLRELCIISEVLRSIHVGLLCVQHHAEDRPTMLSVVLMLVSEGALPQPNQPAFFSEESRRELEYLPSVDEYMITLLHPR
ncbi:hypothetical protein L1887_16472 [Cichorium endivia]|nr:hypothetical protein L1887_16472 [Cichorium endivia]